MDRKMIDDFKRISLEKELQKAVSKGDVTPADIDNLTKSACLVEKLEKIEHYEHSDMGYDEESSMRGGWGVRATYTPMDSYGNSSYRMNRNSYASNGNSYGSSPLVQEAERMLGSARNESERQAIMNFMSSLQGR